MKSVLELIEKRRRKYEDHPYIRYLLDDSRSPQERLAYAPFASHFVLTFSEFNRYFLHSERGSRDMHQQSVDKHAKEDSRHYAWFLEDLQSLGYDAECRFTDALRFVWGDLGRRTRELGYYAIGVARDADPEIRLVIVEAMEAMGNVWLRATLEAAKKHPNYERLIYFGQYHLDRETGHAIGSEHEEIARIDLGDRRRAGAIPIVHGLFDRMEAFNQEILERVGSAYSADGADPGSAIPDFMKF